MLYHEWCDLFYLSLLKQAKVCHHTATKKMRKDIMIFDCPRCDAVILEKLPQFANNEQHM